jgi:hypothetical protein
VWVYCHVICYNVLQNRRRRVLLSGTPIQNHLDEVRPWLLLYKGHNVLCCRSRSLEAAYICCPASGTCGDVQQVRVVHVVPVLLVHHLLQFTWTR